MYVMHCVCGTGWNAMKLLHTAHNNHNQLIWAEQSKYVQYVRQWQLQVLLDNFKNAVHGMIGNAHSWMLSSIAISTDPNEPQLGTKPQCHCSHLLPLFADWLVKKLQRHFDPRQSTQTLLQIHSYTMNSVQVLSGFCSQFLSNVRVYGKADDWVKSAWLRMCVPLLLTSDYSKLWSRSILAGTSNQCGHLEYFIKLVWESAA